MGLWVVISLAMVHGAVCGAPWCCNGRSNFKNHHSYTCKTTACDSSSSGV